MKTAVTQTSIEAYHGQDLTGQRLEVLTAIKCLGDACISDIAAYLNIERSSVAARLNELKKVGAVVFVGKRKSNRTEIMSEFYRARLEGEVVKLNQPKSVNRDAVSEAASILASARVHKQEIFSKHPTLF